MIIEKFTFTNSREESIEIGNSAPFIMLSNDGTGSGEAEVQMQKSPFQDGSTLVDALIDVRNINIQMVIQANDQADLYEKREQMVRILNPKLKTGILKYNYGSGEKEIEATVETAPVFLSGPGNRTESSQRAMLSFICPNPFWRSIDVFDEEMADWVGGLEFPLEIEEEGLELEREGNNRVDIVNEGHVPTPVQIFFFGPAVNPRIENETTGEFIQVNETLDQGDVLLIDTSRGQNKRVEINGESAWSLIDRLSVFWQLDVGVNTIAYSADTGIGTARVLIQYRNRFAGV